MSKLIINRAQWARGDGGFNSKLVRAEDKKMCCLGFYGCAVGGDPNTTPYGGFVGIPTAENGLCGVAYPQTHREMWPRWLFAPFEDPSEIAKKAGVRMPVDADDDERPPVQYSALATVNDSTVLTDAEREAEITRIFALNDVEVEFVG